MLPTQAAAHGLTLVTLALHGATVVTPGVAAEAALTTVAEGLHPLDRVHPSVADHAVHSVAVVEALAVAAAVDTHAAGTKIKTYFL